MDNSAPFPVIVIDDNGQKGSNATGGIMYRVLNRTVGRATLFDSESDYAMFVRVMEQAAERVPLRWLACCLMPNHWHLLLWPQRDVDLPEYMRRLTVTRVQPPD